VENLSVEFIFTSAIQTFTFEGNLSQGLFSIVVSFNTTWLAGVYQIVVVVYDDLPLNASAVVLESFALTGSDPKILNVVGSTTHVLAPNSVTIQVYIYDLDNNIASVVVSALMSDGTWQNKTASREGGVWVAHITTLNQPEGEWVIYAYVTDLDGGVDTTIDNPLIIQVTLVGIPQSLFIGIAIVGVAGGLVALFILERRKKI
jgi:hypothetical protein